MNQATTPTRELTLLAGSVHLLHVGVLNLEDCETDSRELLDLFCELLISRTEPRQLAEVLAEITRATPLHSHTTETNHGDQDHDA